MLKYIVVFAVAIAISFHPSCGVSLRGSGQRFQQRLSIISELDSKQSIRQINNSEKSLLQLDDEKEIELAKQGSLLASYYSAASHLWHIYNVRTANKGVTEGIKNKDYTIMVYKYILEELKRIGSGNPCDDEHVFKDLVNAALEEWRMQQMSSDEIKQRKGSIERPAVDSTKVKRALTDYYITRPNKADDALEYLIELVDKGSKIASEILMDLNQFEFGEALEAESRKDPLKPTKQKKTAMKAVALLGPWTTRNNLWLDIPDIRREDESQWRPQFPRRPSEAELQNRPPSPGLSEAELRNRPPSPGLSEAELRNQQKLISGQKLIPSEEREPLKVWSREREEDEYD